MDMEQFQTNVLPEYDIILLQEVLVHSKFNIIRELMRLKHRLLITMIVPGKIVHKGLFELLSGLEVNVLNVYYDQLSHESLEYVKHLTGRRKEFNFW